MTTPAPERAEFVSGSFRDPDSRVFVVGDRVLRALARGGAEDWASLRETRFFEQGIASGRIVGTREVDVSLDTETPSAGSFERVLEHDRIPVISYPYEWCFGMLKDAALLQLELLLEGLEESITLKDASAYNVQWRGTTPVFIDIGSFERLRPGEPWAGYRQFCMLLLFPLMLQAYRGFDPLPQLRGAVDGIPPAQARAILRGRDVLRRGVLTHVLVQSRLERRYAATEGRAVKKELHGAGFNPEIVKANARRLHKLVSRIEWKPKGTVWTEYGTENTYTDADAQQKAAFVDRVAAELRPRLVWDLGANEGTYSLVAARHAGNVVAVDSDQATVEGLYRRLKRGAADNILPLVMNITDPSPNLGWRGLERPSLPRRGTPDLTLCLAVVHHVAITANVPLREFIAWLRELDTALVIEFVTRDDPMVVRLLAGKEDGAHEEYDIEPFEQALCAHFRIEAREELESRTRILYRAQPVV